MGPNKTVSSPPYRHGCGCAFSVSIKWLCHFIEVALRACSHAEGVLTVSPPCKETLLRKVPKPPRMSLVSD